MKKREKEGGGGRETTNTLHALDVLICRECAAVRKGLYLKWSRKPQKHLFPYVRSRRKCRSSSYTYCNQGM